ncbi:hypothetical protein AQUCO_01100051v1 [Aquilegia coerulea]|uniref:Uncharacterized protein n=1 Tax=Aquilegia coerulea TaxID=218851 RepID=A0A2G5E602_AQUCA|nr:hypothetical protein AQUCO_01100051v1 [Aquilegia coerulea]
MRYFPELVCLVEIYTYILGYVVLAFDSYSVRHLGSGLSSTILSKSSMAKFITFFVILGFLCLTTFAKSPRPITDYEVREKKDSCYADIESGLWGWECKSSMIAKENCALKCLSPVCYSLIYESDPLEEGEKDYVRGQEYKYCMHRISIGESLDGVKGSFA